MGRVARGAAVAALLLLATGVAARAHAELRVYAVDGAGSVRPIEKARASMQRRVPARVPDDPSLPHGDPDALRYLIAAPAAELPATIDIQSATPDGRPLAKLSGVVMSSLPCPASLASSSAGELCAVTPPIRAVADAIDAGHPLVRDRSLVATLGGALRLESGDVRLASVRVAGPRRTALGPIDRLRAQLRFVMVRLSPGGALPLGADREGALDVAREAQARASALWGACGISFGPERDVNLTVVDPPPAHLLAIGCDHGLPASGGKVAVVIQGRQHEVRVDAGMTPRQVARRFAATLRRSGYQVRVSDNPRMSSGADTTSDLSVRTAQGKLVELAPPRRGPISSDASLTACIGRVNLEDGLQHFGDVDAAVGTLEERTLIKAYDDLDPTTIEVLMVAGFGRGGRIGESFIGADAGSVRNVVIVDRAGVRSNQASFTLAHELGHVLLDDPGHPDDFGVDTPSRLMDADASDPSAFGPRRLSIHECERALRQSGPGAPTQLLTPWPIE